MRHPARRKALLVGVVCAVALLGAGLAFREDLAFHYHAWRLDRVLTVEDAWPWLRKLEDDVRDPARAQRLVAMLGPRRPRLTFWAFEWPHITVLIFDSRIGLVPAAVDAFPVVAGIRHFARSLENRLRRDEGFLAVMAHFIRWDKRSWMLLNQIENRRLLNFFDALKSELLRRDPVAQEDFWRTLEAWLLAEVWLLGMSPLPPRVELSFPVAMADLERLERRWDEVQTWVQARRWRLSFDPALGRFVMVWWGKGSHEVPVPAEPVPGWTGPVPRLP